MAWGMGWEDNGNTGDGQIEMKKKQKKRKKNNKILFGLNFMKSKQRWQR
jgi:hypothetical protein